MNIKTQLTTYRYDISVEAERKRYKILRKQLLKTRKCFDVYADSRTSPLHTSRITLETKHIFNNQWNSNQGRVFDWYEGIYPNKQLKTGHYLELTKKMLDLRHDTKSCGFCGKQYQTKKLFCLSCLDSSYLKHDDLCLLRLQRIDNTRERGVLSIEEAELLSPLYVKAQVTRAKNMKKETTKQLRIDLQQKYTEAVHTANTEYYGFLSLLDKNINTDNCIYYSHTDTFTFGWRQPISLEVKKSLEGGLQGWGYRVSYRVDYENN